MNKMSKQVRTTVIDIAQKSGFPAMLKSDGSDEYVKNLMFRMPYSPHFLFIRKEGVATDSVGMPRYFQVVVHPEEFRHDLIEPTHSVHELVNRRTKQNLTPSSNYRGFPNFPGYKVPCGKGYRVDNFDALEHLLTSLAASLTSSAGKHAKV